LPVGLYQASQRGPLLEECLLPAEAKTLDVKVVRPTGHLRVILQTSLLAVAWASICPDWASAIRRNLDSRPHTSPTWSVPPIDKPRCTYYLGACLEQGKATRLKQDSPVRDLAPQPPVLPSIASKHLETLVTGASETLVGSYWLSNFKASLPRQSGSHFRSHRLLA
jgi:hypothetical protein